MSFGLFRFEPIIFFVCFMENLVLMLLFLFFSVCFETGLFVSVVLKRVKNTETNRNKKFLVLRNKPKIDRNRLSFGLFRFEPTNFFVCFENTLAQTATNYGFYNSTKKMQFFNEV
jgi:hypothetical protein